MSEADEYGPGGMYESGPSTESRRFTTEEWPFGLLCMDCEVVFVEGQPISERLVAMDEFEGEPMVVVELICFGCATAGQN